MRRDDQRIKKIFEQSFIRADAGQMDTSCERVWQRLSFLKIAQVDPAATEAPHTTRTWRVFVAVPAIAFAAMVLLMFPVIREMIWPQNVYAKVLDGSVERLNGGKTLRTGNGSGALVALSDNSRIEMRTESELSLERAADGIRIRLEKGNVIVDAVTQGKGHLYLQTKDVTVSGGNTVFLVDAAVDGSHVAVIDGEARLDAGTTEQILRPGQLVATTPGMPAQDIDQAVAWSRSAQARLAMLQRNLTGSIGTNGTVAGVVRASDGRPASNVRVTALRADTIATIRATLSLTETDSDGRYRLENVPPGSFYITAGRLDVPTYYPGTLEIKDAQIVSVTSAGTLTGIDFVVQDPSTAPPPPQPLVVKPGPPASIRRFPLPVIPEEQKKALGEFIKQLDQKPNGGQAGEEQQTPESRRLQVEEMIKSLKPGRGVPPVVPPVVLPSNTKQPDSDPQQK
jgi:ferric-dicitrate binding protein FerR (iron transport regulator)